MSELYHYLLVIDGTDKIYSSKHSLKYKKAWYLFRFKHLSLKVLYVQIKMEKFSKIYFVMLTELPMALQNRGVFQATRFLIFTY